MIPPLQIDALISPMVLAFLLGIAATLLKSDLRFPDELHIGLTIFLLLAIGLKGGYKLSFTPFEEFWQPGLAALLLGVAIPVWSYVLLEKLGGFGPADAAALAAHYGSVSVVTFSQALAFHESLGIPVEGFLPSLLAIMEVPAIIIALLIGRSVLQRRDPDALLTPAGDFARELLAGKGTILLLGGLLIGYIGGEAGWMQVRPFFDEPFRGVLALFLLEAGLVTGKRLGDLRTVGPFLLGFGVLMPAVHALLGILLGKAAGLSLGGSTMLGVLAASASYIAAPAAVRAALPQAQPTYYLTAALVITFPFNIIVGIPLYHALARWIFGA